MWVHGSTSNLQSHLFGSCSLHRPNNDRLNSDDKAAKYAGRSLTGSCCNEQKG